MIHGFLQSCQEDLIILSQWMKGDKMELSEEEIQNRVQLAAFRLLATLAMVIGACCALNLITFAITFPIVVTCQLTLAIGFYAIAHDVFIMSQNTTYPDFAPQKVKSSSLWGWFRGKEISEEEQARKFTHGTFLQPAWMWLYVNRNNIQEKIEEKFTHRND